MKGSRSASIGLLLVIAMACSVAQAGPLAGTAPSGGQVPEAQSNLTETSEDNPDQARRESVAPPTADVLVSSYLETMRQQVLPDIDSSATGLEALVDLDRLEGWSLEEIAAAFAPDDPNQATGNQVNEIRSLDDGLVVSVEDLYAFNAGYYFSLTQGDEDQESGEVLSAPDIPELMGISALGTLEFNSVRPDTGDFGISVNSSNLLFDQQFYEAVSRSATENRTFGNVSFRSNLLANQIQRSGGGTPGNRDTGEAIPLLVFIQRIIAGLRENWLTFLLVGTGVSSVVYVATRFGN